MKVRSPRILFACGGTGGHVYPAIAIADALRMQVPTAVVSFAGTRKRMEWEAVPQAGYPIHPIAVEGFRRSLTLQNLRFPFMLLKGFMQSWQLVKDFDPDVVVGTGGFVAGPVLLAAHLQGRPTLIQEQNAYAGVTNRLLGRWVDRIHLAFEAAESYFPADKEKIVSGNPTRQVLQEGQKKDARAHFGIPPEARVLFVFGGSGGSAAINKAMNRHANTLMQDKQLHILWQTGKKYHADVKAEAPQHSRLHLMDYVERMEYAYGAADLVVGRSGAITCSELMVTGTPAVLVPSPNVAADHQTTNARAMAAQGAAVLLAEAELEKAMVPLVNELLHDRPRREQMSRSAQAMARADAAEQIAQDVLDLGGGLSADLVNAQGASNASDVVLEAHGG